MTFTDPGVDLQRAIVAAVKASAAFSAIAQDRMFDVVPRKADGEPTVPFPYVTLGETQTLPELGEGTDAAETFVTLHTWSREVGSGEVKRLNATVIAALHDVPLTLANGAVQSLLLQQSHTLRDPDGITSHGILIFQVLTDANEESSS